MEIPEYSSVTKTFVPPPVNHLNRVIEYKSTIYAWITDKLWAYDQSTDIWSEVAFPDGLLLTDDGLFVGESKQGQEWLTEKGASLCICPTITLMNRGCICGGI